MYTIKQAAARSGLSIPLLRAWERRYGLVRPRRTESGYRLYDDRDIARLRAVRHLVGQGWAPSAAAASVLTLPEDEIVQLSDAARAAPEGSTDLGDDLAAEFVAAAARRDSAQLDEVLDRVFAAGTFEYVVDRHLMPALVQLGAAWEAGEVDVAAEHAASHAVLRRLGAAFEAAGSSRLRGLPVLVGLPPGSLHELGALAFAVGARRAGLAVIYEGPDLPITDWVEASEGTRARALVLGVVTSADVDSARSVIGAVHASRPDLLIAVGGRSAHQLEPMDRTIRLVGGLADEVDALRAALR
jgi:DNA-binding transcriptional MerR regulator